MSRTWAKFCEEQGIDTNDRQALRIWGGTTTKRNDDGSPAFTTEQKDRDRSDINNIVRQFDAKGILELQNQFSMDETVLAGINGNDYHASQNLLAKVNQEFEQLPSKVRNEFNNSPEAYVEFLARPTEAKDQIDELDLKPKKKKVVEAPVEPVVEE